MSRQSTSPLLPVRTFDLMPPHRQAAMILFTINLGPDVGCGKISKYAAPVQRCIPSDPLLQAASLLGSASFGGGELGDLSANNIEELGDLNIEPACSNSIIHFDANNSL